MKALFRVLLLFVFCVITTHANYGVEPIAGTIWDLVNTTWPYGVNTRTLASYIREDKRLREMLSNPRGSYTLFAFADFVVEQRLSPDTYYIVKNKHQCSNGLGRELVIPEAIEGWQIREGESGFTFKRNLNRTTVTLGRFGGHLDYNGQIVQKEDIRCTNGVVHMLNHFPSIPKTKSVLGAALERYNHEERNYFDLLFERTNMSRLPHHNYKITLFLPPNEQLQSLMDKDDDTVYKTIRNHIVYGSIDFDSEQSNDRMLLAQSGQNHTLRIPKPDWSNTEMWQQPLIGCARVTRSLPGFCDGDLHYIDKLLAYPEQTVYALLESKPELSKFTDLVRVAGLTDVFDSKDFDGTLMAVTNKGMDINDRYYTLASSRTESKEFIEKHMRNHRQCCHSLNGVKKHDKSASPTNTITWDDTLKLPKECDLLATNGIVHVLNQPLQ